LYSGSGLSNRREVVGQWLDSGVRVYNAGPYNRRLYRAMLYGAVQPSNRCPYNDFLLCNLLLSNIAGPYNGGAGSEKVQQVRGDRRRHRRPRADPEPQLRGRIMDADGQVGRLRQTG
jgi:hypothetical protein